MCGIAALIHSCRHAGDAEADLRSIAEMLRPIVHRGDREHRGEVAAFDRGAMGANRLAIVGRDDGRQPVTDAEARVWVVLNGEIYNYQDLRRQLRDLGHAFRTETDTEVLVHGYKQWGLQLLDRLDGMFAFVLYDQAQSSLLAARDHIGIKPLYFARGVDTCYFASEQKSLLRFGREIHTLPPGHFMLDGRVGRYFELSDEPLELAPGEIVEEFRALFVAAVRKRVQTDLPIAVALSGGLDSTAVLHIAKEHHGDVSAFTIGFAGAADIEVARRYCRDFSIPHHVAYLDEDDLVDIIPRVVYEAELFEGIDVMDTCLGYFAYRPIRAQGIKVALCGEGSDEVLAGYDLFRSHPDKIDLMRYRVANLHRTDIQRVDRSSMMNSVEARVPFLDKHFLSFAYRVPMAMKLRGGVEKWILREAFRGDLPDYIAERPKVRMPDGTGLKNRLFDHAGQGAVLPPELACALTIRTPQEAFFLKQYCDAGFPWPTERFRRVAYDFAEHGYFDFVT